MKFKAIAPAKINLGLEIISKNEDGYHNLDMIMQTISLTDEIIIEKTNTNDIEISYNKKVNYPYTEDITYKCAKLFFKKIKKEHEGILIKINKKIPESAGLAGGSSDGAATLLILNRMYEEILSLNELMEIGGKVGTDIPFCILGGTARATKTGTTLKSIPTSKNNYFLVLVKPEISISTREAYELSDNMEIKNIRNFDNLESVLATSNTQKIIPLLFNRFENIIKEKNIIKEIKNEFMDLKASCALMSGSGPTVYSIFFDETQAKKCFEEMSKKYTNSFLCVPLNHGAKII